MVQNKIKTNGYQPIIVGDKVLVKGKERSRTAKIIFDRDLSGKSVLDIGCAYGYFCQYAKVQGASEVVGLEPRQERYKTAKEVAVLNKLDIEYVNTDLAGFECARKFDYVLLLNVLHHVTNPVELMIKCAGLSKEFVFVEFTTVADLRFLKRSGISKVMSYFLRKYPLIGIGPDEYKTTFYFSKKSFELLFQTHLKLFRKIEFTDSPTGNNRLIAKCNV